MVVYPTIFRYDNRDISFKRKFLENNSLIVFEP